MTEACFTRTVRSRGHADSCSESGACAVERCSPPAAPFPPRPPQKLPSLVRSVHRYYGAVRLLQHVHVRRSVYGLRGPAFAYSRRRAGDLPVLVHVVSQRARVLRLRRTGHPLAITQLPVLPSSYGMKSASCSIGFSKLNSPAHWYLCLRFAAHLAMYRARLEARMESLSPFLSTRACGPRKLMKITPSRMQNRTGSERRDRPYSGEVETVFLSDPECAWLSE